MAATVETVEIACRPEETFAYATDFSHFPDWQVATVSVRRDDESPVRVGSRAAVATKVGPRMLEMTQEVTELNAPRSWTVRGVGGPVIPIAKGTVEPLAEGEHSRLTVALDFEGHGIGKLLVPLVIRRQARRQLPRNVARLKELLESKA
jgi:carbon monoxide dehydrogenase subunit G